MDQPQPVKTSPKEFFLYLLLNIALYYCAGWLVSLLYDYIDYSAGTVNYYNTEWLPSSMRWAMASLFVVFPLYIVIARSLNRDLESHPEKRDLRVRKWLMYLTLSLASVAIVIDIIALINEFLGGEFAATFFLKALAVAIVAGLIFAYYFYELRRDAGKTAPRHLLFRWAAILLVTFSVFGGFVVVGSPQVARQKQYDAQRVIDLSSLQVRITSYYQYKQHSPATLADLVDLLGDASMPADPETGEAYDYKVTGPLSFRLCAVFDRAGDGGALTQPAPYGGNPKNTAWSHDVGKTCFDRTIDPDMYPSIK